MVIAIIKEVFSISIGLLVGFEIACIIDKKDKGE